MSDIGILRQDLAALIVRVKDAAIAGATDLENAALALVPTLLQQGLGLLTAIPGGVTAVTTDALADAAKDAAPVEQALQNAAETAETTFENSAAPEATPTPPAAS